MSLPNISPSNLINSGDAWDYSSIEFVLGGVPFPLVSDIDFTEERTVGHLRGTSPYKLGRTKGTYDANGSFTMYKKDFDLVLVPQLVAGGKGYMTAEFTIALHFGETASAGSTNELKDCTIVNVNDAFAQGEEGLVVKCDIDIMRVLRNGIEGMDPGASGTGALGAAAGGLLGGLGS